MITSGAIQKGVPTKVFRLFMDSVSCPATPKSANFTAPFSDSNTFAAVVSKTAFVKPHPPEHKTTTPKLKPKYAECYEPVKSKTYIAHVDYMYVYMYM